MSAINTLRSASPAPLPTASATDRPVLSRSPSTEYHESSDSLSSADVLEQPATSKAAETSQPEASTSAKTNKLVGFVQASYANTKSVSNKVASAIAGLAAAMGNKTKQGAIASYNFAKNALVATGSVINNGATKMVDGFKAFGSKVANTFSRKSDGAETLQAIVNEGKGKARAQDDDVQA